LSHREARKEKEEIVEAKDLSLGFSKSTYALEEEKLMAKFMLSQ
jgi:hypothetical protein